MKVQISDAVSEELVEIWRWNARKYGLERADAYIQFLSDSIWDLDQTFWLGTAIEDYPDYRYLRLGKPGSRYAHVVVFRLSGEIIAVDHLFHSAQDWTKKL